MNEQTIKLEFPKDLSKLAGNRYGKKIFDEQVKGIIDYSKNITFVLPNGIDRVASSFIQGFFDSIMLELGWSGIQEKINFQTKIDDFKSFVMDNLR